MARNLARARIELTSLVNAGRWRYGDYAGALHPQQGCGQGCCGAVPRVLPSSGLKWGGCSVTSMAATPVT